MSRANAAGPQDGDGAMTAPVVVDARGLRCPLPVIRLARAARDTAPGSLIEVWATDPAARADIPAWCRMRGQEFLGEAPGEGAHTAYRVRTAP